MPELIRPTVNAMDSAVLAYETALSELRQSSMTESQIDAQKIQRSEIQLKQTLAEQRRQEAARLVEAASIALENASSQKSADMKEVLLALERLDRETRGLKSLERNAELNEENLSGIEQSMTQAEHFLRAEAEQRERLTALASQVLVDALAGLPNLGDKVIFGRWFRAEFFNPDTGPGIRLGEKWKRAKLDYGRQSENSSIKSTHTTAAEVLIVSYQTWQRILRENGRDPSTHYSPKI